MQAGSGKSGGELSLAHLGTIRALMWLMERGGFAPAWQPADPGGVHGFAATSSRGETWIVRGHDPIEAIGELLEHLEFEVPA